MSASVRAGRAVGGQGVYLQTRLLAGDGSGDVADFTWDGSTLVTSANGRVDLQIDVQAPSWAPYRFISVYANATTTPASVVVTLAQKPMMKRGVPRIVRYVCAKC